MSDLKNDILRLADQLEGFAKDHAKLQAESESLFAQGHASGSKSTFRMAAQWMREIAAKEESHAT